MKYFSDRESGGKTRTEEVISIAVWNGLVSLIKSYIDNNALAKSFPKKCPDGNGICGCDEESLEDQIIAFIPNLGNPLSKREEKHAISWLPRDSTNEDTLDTYAILDYIEFIHNHIADVKNDKFHDFRKHYELKFDECGKYKATFREQINELFSRNQLAYKLNDNGLITRIIPKEFDQVLKEEILTKDDDLNRLLNASKELFFKPGEVNKQLALEKLWDAFERAKTYYPSLNKKNSIEQIMDIISEGNANIKEEINDECKALTIIGNNFQIRHFETDKIPLTSEKHIEYLYYRMFSFIHLFLTSEKEGKLVDEESNN